MLRLRSQFSISLQEKQILPNILTSEISYYQNYTELREINEPICILDLGHTTTKAYFLKDSRVIATHTNYVAACREEAAILGKHVSRTGCAERARRTMSTADAHVGRVAGHIAS